LKQDQFHELWAAGNAESVM